MSESLARAPHDAVESGASAQPHRKDAALCFILDEEPSICHFLSLVLQGSGVDTQEFHDHQLFRQGLDDETPDLVFLNVPLDTGEAIGTLVALGKRHFQGAIQLISNRGSAVLEHVKHIGQQHRLRMLPVLKKPFDTPAIIRIVQELKLGHLSEVAARIGLGDALQNKWIEFWYQPKIDLRRKQLVGAEAFARARHPNHGVLSPESFMPGSDEASMLALSELALKTVLKTGHKFSQLGLNIQLSVNIPVDALVELPLADIIKQYRKPNEKWPGLIIDVTEDQIVTDLALANAITKQLRQFNIKLAIDDFGRGYSSLTRLKELPFAEIKLDRSFVTDCGTDKVNAPLCKAVIDLAHSFGSVAVAIGIEKASDVVALISMGCDYGQGFLLGQPMPEDRFIALLRQRLQARTAGTASSEEQQKAALRKLETIPASRP